MSDVGGGSMSRASTARHGRRRYRVSRHPSLERAALHRGSGSAGRGGSGQRGGAANPGNRLSEISPLRCHGYDGMQSGDAPLGMAPLGMAPLGLGPPHARDDLKITASQKELMTSTVDSGVESLAAAGKQLQDSYDEDPDEAYLQGNLHPSNSSIPTSSPLPPSTGMEQVDKALLQHLVHCERLMENLGAFGPLKCREIFSLEALARQAVVLQQLLQVVTDFQQQQNQRLNSSSSRKSPTLLPEAILESALDVLLPADESRLFWRRCSEGAGLDATSKDPTTSPRDSGATYRDSGATSLQEGGSVKLVVPASIVMDQLNRHFGDYVRGAFPAASHRIFAEFLARVLDQTDVESTKPKDQRQTANNHRPADGAPTTRYSDGASDGQSDAKRTTTAETTIVTVYQLAEYLKKFDTNPLPISAAVHRLGAELCSTRNLMTANPDLVIKELLRFRDNLEGAPPSLPPPSCLKAVSLILLCPSQHHSEILRSVDSFMKQLNSCRTIREDAILTFVEALEDNSDPDFRAGGCIALSRLRAKESSDRLVYLCQTDPSMDVRAKAKDALLSFGDEGRKAFEETRLTAHGFQGIKL